jgi:hypothetical protein
MTERLTDEVLADAMAAEIRRLADEAETMDGDEKLVLFGVDDARKIADALARRATHADDLLTEAAFFIDRLDSFLCDHDEVDSDRDWMGHVAPSFARLRMEVDAAALAQKDASQ